MMQVMQRKGYASFRRILTTFLVASVAITAHALDENPRRRTNRFRSTEAATKNALLEELLQQEALLAERETGRLLQNGGLLSFPTIAPSRGSVITQAPAFNGPSSAPITQTPVVDGTPTLAPAGATDTLAPSGSDSTDAPTQSGGVTFAPSVDSSCLNGTTPESYLISRLSSITDPVLLADVATPQGQAVQFLANEDPLDPDLCTYPTLEQRYGLSTLYFATNGDTWTNNSGWLGPTPECEWLGVICNDNVVATNVTLEENNLVGSIPNEISTLPELDRLELAVNGLVSSIPSTIANLTKLVVLDLEANNLTGNPFGNGLLDLPILKQVFLSSNSFTGSIPSDIGSLTLLEEFWIAGNELMGSIPTGIGSLTELKSVFLYDNRLDGTLPSEIASLTGLTNFQIQNNVLVGILPQNGFPSLTALTTLRLDFNFFSGTTPSTIGDLIALTDLRVNNNFLTGELPASLASLTNLRFLTVNTNFLVGSLSPTMFTDFTQLDTVDLSSCFFEGTLPASLFDSATLRLAYLNNNQFSGRIPENFSNSPLLRDIFLNNNLLTGPVPDIAVGELFTLNEFVLQANLLTGSMPANVCDLRSTGILDNLFADCAGPVAEIECEFPTCCNRCFESNPAARRQLQLGAARNELPGLEFVQRQETRDFQRHVGLSANVSIPLAKDSGGKGALDATTQPFS
jgi:Leucine-rich repeat (LRR) protein